MTRSRSFVESPSAKSAARDQSPPEDPADAVRSLEERLRFETLISDLSAAIVNAAAADVDAAITDVLRQVAERLKLATCALLSFSAESNELAVTHVCSPDKGDRALDRLLIDPDARARLEADEPVALGSDSDGPHETASASWLLIPVHAGGIPHGALGFETGVSAAPWTSDVVQRLRLLGDIMANTLSRTRTAEELAAAEARFSLAVAGSTDGIWDWDIESGELFYSDRCLELAGFTREEVDPDVNTFENHIHPDDVAQNTEAIRRHLTERVPYDVEYRLRTLDGDYRWFHARGQAIWDSTVRALRMAGSIQDIDARKRAEAALVSAAKRFVSVTGDELYQSLVKHLAESLQADYAFIGMLHDDGRDAVRTKAVYADGEIIENFDYDLKDTPCAEVIRQLNCVYPSGVQELFPKDEMLAELGIEAYIGTTLLDSRAQPRGLAGLLYRRPLAETEAAHSTLKIVAGHISAELERSQFDDALRSSERRIRHIFDLGLIGMSITSPEKQWIEVNDRLCEILGYTREELYKLTWVDISHPDDVAIDVAQFQRVLAGEIDGYARDKRYITKSGDVINVSIAVNCSRQPDGTVEYFTALVQDITDRKRAEQALHASEQHLRAIIDTTPACVKLHTPQGTVLQMNAPGLALIEAESFDDVRGNSVYDLIVAEYHEAYRDFVDRVCAGEKAIFEFEVEGRRATRRFMETRGVPLQLPDHRLVVLAVTHDITDRKKAEDVREALIQELESKNAELERFTYTVSHDLKSPLVTIKGFLGMLQRDLAAGDSLAVKDDVNEIGEAADKMAQLLDGLLELSRVGRIANPSEAVDMSDIVSQVLRTSSGGIRQKGVNVTVAPKLPTIVGDRLRLLEVMQNLIDNAVRYCSPIDPQVEIGVRTVDGETCFYVRNNGMGIEPEYHERVFKRFEQLDADGAGSGIGLTIVKRIIEVHGGRIWVESAGAQSGCTFAFSLP